MKKNNTQSNIKNIMPNWITIEEAVIKVNQHYTAIPVNIFKIIYNAPKNKIM